MFGRLSPEDLIALTRTSKVLCETLLACNSITVWKAALESVRAPKHSPDWSERRWTWFLFGSRKLKCDVSISCVVISSTNHTTQCCGEEGVKNIDFMLRRRVCVPCKKSKLRVFLSSLSIRPPIWCLASFLHLIFLDMTPSFWT